MPSNAILEVNNIWKKISHHVLVNDISFNLYEGDILGFIGPNGAGKTTTMKLILGLQSTNGGTIKIAGHDIKKEFATAIKNVGAIIENPDVYMYMTGYENLKISAKIYGIKRKRIEEVIEIVGLKDKIHESVKKYSLGMRQRLGIAIAILHKPKVLILDEPMNGLDPKGIDEFKKLLLSLAKEEKMAILISSHILSELENICNRVCIISNGTILKDDNIKNIKEVTDKITYTIELNNTKLDNILYNYQVIDNNHIKIISKKENINTIIKTLILNNISIYEIKKEKKSLENIFLEILKEEQRDKINHNRTN